MVTGGVPPPCTPVSHVAYRYNDESTDFCPPPFNDWETQPTTSNTTYFCNQPLTTGTAWLRGAYYDRSEFYCYRLNPTMQGLPLASMYRCLQGGGGFGSGALSSDMRLRCDLNISSTQASLYRSQPLLLAQRVATYC